jgi:hypothetical protein
VAEDGDRRLRALEHLGGELVDARLEPLARLDEAEPGTREEAGCVSRRSEVRVSLPAGGERRTP